MTPLTTIGIVAVMVAVVFAVAVCVVTRPPILALPVTFRETKEPTLVILGCDAVASVPEKKFAVTKFPSDAFPLFTLPMAVNVVPRIVPLLAYTLPAITFAVTNTDDSVPIDVILGCDAVTSVPEKKFAVTKLPRLAFAAFIFPFD